MEYHRTSPFTELSGRLASLTHFLEAVEDLRTLLLLTPSHISSHPNKLIALLEVAKYTLKRAGIKLHTFTACRPPERSYKTAYFNLLCEAQTHIRGVIKGNAELQMRLNRLLFPLTSQLHIVRSKDTVLEHTCSLYRTDTASDSGSSSSSSSSPLVANIETLQGFQIPIRTTSLRPPPPGSMQPPDSSTVAATQPSVSELVSRTFRAPPPPSMQRARTAASVRRRPRETDNITSITPGTVVEMEIENVAPSIPSIVKAPRRSFGILFTGKRQSVGARDKQYSRITFGP